MVKIYKNCNPTVLDQKELLSNDLVCMTNQVIKEQCSCIFKNLCMTVNTLLEKNKVEEAMDLFLTMKQSNGKNPM